VVRNLYEDLSEHILVGVNELFKFGATVHLLSPTSILSTPIDLIRTINDIFPLSSPLGVGLRGYWTG
jgi:hypothetical protein